VGQRSEAGEEDKGQGCHLRGGVRKVVRNGVEEEGFASYLLDECNLYLGGLIYGTFL
jgi:hypothetical protein